MAFIFMDLIYNSITTSDEKHTYMINYAHASLPSSSLQFIKSFYLYASGHEKLKYGYEFNIGFAT